MMNKPRPRKIINVIKSSSSPEPELAAEDSSKAEPVSLAPIRKPASPVVPQFGSVNSAGLTYVKPSTSNNQVTSTSTSTANTQVTSTSIPTDNNSSTPPPANFIPRKPIVATLKKAHVPPPPTFSDSPKSSPIDANHNRPSIQPINQINNSNSVSPVLSSSPKSSGEAFLDAADKAADFIGGALLNSFKSFNLTDNSTVKFEEATKEKEKDEDPFADIMKKLKSPNLTQSETKPIASAQPIRNLMDEEPPESFNSNQEENDIIKPSRKPLKNAEPSSFIKAAFSPKESKEQVEVSKTEIKLTDFTELTKSEPVITEKLSVAESVPVTTEKLTETEPVPLIFESKVVITPNIAESHETETFNSPNKPIDDVPYESSEYVPANEKTLTIENNACVSEKISDEYLEHKPHTIDHETIVKNTSNTFLTEESRASPSTIPFFDNLSTTSSNSDSSANFLSPPRTGFRASLLKHGLSALEKIGKSTADVVVSTRNKLATEATVTQGPMITPDYNDETSTFYEIFKLYGGYSKLQELQLRSVRASIAMKLGRRNQKPSNFCTIDYQARLKQHRQISSILHPDRIMESIDDCNGKDLFKLDSFPILSDSEDELFCIQKLLKSLDNILIIEPVLIPSNKRRHVICQVATVLCALLIRSASNNNPLQLANEVSLLTAHIIKYLQTNFALNCESSGQADRDQQLAIKLFLDISYSIVPQLQ